MNPIPGRNIVAIVVGLLIAMYLATALGSGEGVAPAIIVTIIVGALARALAFRAQRFEGMVIGGLLFVDIFAQSGLPRLSLAGQSAPLYLTEVALILCVIGVLQRIAFTKERFFEATPLTVALSIFLVIASVRFMADCVMRREDLSLLKTSIRDFATVYYAAFFLIAYSACRHVPTRRFLEKTLPVAILALIPLRAISILFPNALARIAIRGEMLFAPRADLSGAFLGFGCIYFLLRRGEAARTPFVWLCYTAVAFVCFGEMIVGLSRATFVAFGAGLVLMLLARKWRVVRDAFLFAIVGALMLITVERVTGVPSEERLTDQFVDKFRSVMDIGSSSHTYRTDAGEAASGNTRFRTIWWQTVTNETLDAAPLTGLGFGYDLAAAFLRQYPFDLGEEFSARSPHSILFTIFGRTGLLGITAFVIFVLVLLHHAVRCTLAVRRRETSATNLSYWCGVIIIFSAACFGVMLEGPMAATVFWTMLAIAARHEHLRLAGKDAPRAVEDAQSTEGVVRHGDLRPALTHRPVRR